jgi:ABC-type iron transport system FetAB permease component
MWSARPLILFLIVLLSQTVWLMVSAGLGSAAVAEGGYYLILLVLGYALSYWGNSKQYVPVVMAVLLLLIGSTWQTIQFINNPSAQFRFGPEIVIFAVSQVVGRLTMLPLDAVVVWGAWAVGEQIKKPSNKASHVEKKP